MEEIVRADADHADQVDLRPLSRRHLRCAQRDIDGEFRIEELRVYWGTTDYWF